MINNYVLDLFKILENTVFDNAERVLERFDDGIILLFNTFRKHKKSGSCIFFVGNGGSAAIASHMTVDFMKNGGMNTVSLYDSAVMTCLGNDYGYEYVFSKTLEVLAKPGDLLVAISSSGNSENIVNSITVAKSVGTEVITLTGFEENNRCRNLGDLNIYVPCREYGKIETIHVLILQQIVDMMMDER